MQESQTHPLPRLAPDWGLLAGLVEVTGAVGQAMVVATVAEPAMEVAGQVLLGHMGLSEQLSRAPLLPMTMPNWAP